MNEKDRRGGDRPKKSWREIDANRDRSRSGSASPSPGNRGPGASADHASKQHRAALEAMFAKGEVGKLAEKLAAPSTPAPPRAPVAVAPAAPVTVEANPKSGMRKKILEAVGRDQISRAVDKYVEAHGMPADYELLEQALEHTREERIAEALTTLERMLEKERPKRSRALAGKLRFLEETSPDVELRARAAAIRTKLG